MIHKKIFTKKQRIVFLKHVEVLIKIFGHHYKHVWTPSMYAVWVKMYDLVLIHMMLISDQIKKKPVGWPVRPRQEFFLSIPRP